MITFLGDVFLKDPVSVEVQLEGDVVFNLEAPLTDRTVGYPGKINLKGAPGNLAASFPRLPAAVSLANNHVMDFFEGGLEDTLGVLSTAGIGCFGAGDASNGFRNPFVLESSGVRVALLGYADASTSAVFGSESTVGVAKFDLERVLADMADARRAGSDRVVVQLHWGEEQVGLPSPAAIVAARQIVAAGADLIIGHHSHCIQSFEELDGKHVFYGLGNCVFPAHRSPSHFDANGVATAVHDSVSAPWNRTSLAVTWNPVDNSVRIAPLAFVKGRLRSGRFSPLSYRLPERSMEEHALAFERSLRLGKLRYTLARFAQRPKLPGIRHVRGVWRIVTGSGR